MAVSKFKLRSIDSKSKALSTFIFLPIFILLLMNSHVSLKIVLNECSVTQVSKGIDIVTECVCLRVPRNLYLNISFTGPSAS